MLALPMKEYISGSTSGIDWMDSTKLSRETSHIASFTEIMQGKQEYHHKNHQCFYNLFKKNGENANTSHLTEIKHWKMQTSPEQPDHNPAPR